MNPDPSIVFDLSWLLLFDAWSWLTLAGVLIILELIAPGVFLLWIGVAAALVGGLMFVVPDLHWEGQVIAFAIFSAITIGLQQLWFNRYPIQTEQPNLNRRGHQYIGRTFTLVEPIVNGLGKIRVDDSTWKIRGPDCKIATTVTVIGVDSTILLVECSGEANNQ